MSFYARVMSQSTVTLNECLIEAKENYPLHNELSMVDEQLELRLKNLNAQYYPALNLNAQFSYQNDVPHIESESIPFELPVGPKDQYKASVDIQQVIFDAGRIKASKEVEELSYETTKSSLEIDLFKIRSKVIETYFLILTIQEQIKQLDYKQATIRSQLKVLQSGVKNGMVLSSEADQLKVELLTSDQQKIKLNHGKFAATKILEKYVGRKFDNDLNLVVPDDIANISISVRPEYMLFKDQSSLFDSREKLIHKNRLPFIAGFGQVGYGNPTYNMLQDEFGTYYMVGIKLKWNIWDWKQSAREGQYFQIQRNRIGVQQQVFDLNIQIAQESQNSKILQMEQVMDKDDEILQLRKRVTVSSASRMENGSITAAEYLSDLNAESVAALSKQIHQLELVKAKIEMNELGQ